MDRQARAVQKQKKKSEWAKDCDGVIFVQATPNGELAKRYRDVVDNFPGKVKFKVEEKGGKKY